MRITHRALGAWLLSAAVSGLIGGAASLTPQASLADPVDGTTVVAVGGIEFQHFTTTWGGRSPQARAGEVQERINHTLSVGPVHPSDITVGQLDGDWVVLFRGKRLLTADPVAAKQQKSSPQTLCNRWAASLRKVLPDLTKPTG